MTKFTVGDLRRHLAAYHEDEELEFGGGLTFSRVKGDDSGALIEFAEIEADLTEETRRTILVAFCRAEPFGDGLTQMAYARRL